MLIKAYLKEIRKVIREEVEAESQNAKEELQVDLKMNLVRTLTEVRDLKDRLKIWKLKQLRSKKAINMPLIFWIKKD